MRSLGLVSMEIKKIFTKQRILFLVLFSIAALIAYQLNFSKMLGTENKYFTFFQFFGPVTGAFLGPFLGAISILLTELMNFFIIGNELNILNFVRVTPMIFAAFYFGSSGKKNLVAAIPIICMALFMLHPVGAQAWYYSLYWLIPLIAKLLKPSLLFRSLGATFTAHAIGSVIFLYTIPTTPQLWQTLIPIVLYERALFALGISASYLMANNFFIVMKSKVPKISIATEDKYDFVKGVFVVKNRGY